MFNLPVVITMRVRIVTMAAVAGLPLLLCGCGFETSPGTIVSAHCKVDNLLAVGAMFCRGRKSRWEYLVLAAGAPVLKVEKSVQFTRSTPDGSIHVHDLTVNGRKLVITLSRSAKESEREITINGSRHIVRRGSLLLLELLSDPIRVEQTPIVSSYSGDDPQRVLGMLLEHVASRLPRNEAVKKFLEKR